MRNILTIFSLTAIVFAGCKKANDRAFTESPDQRISASLNKYQSQLEDAENGWVVYIAPDSGRGVHYGFYFKFDNKNRVKMYSDFTQQSATTIKESSYRLKALQQITLLFDTYSYIHLLADPDPDVAGGEVGAGYGVDFEFYFDGYSKDTINLVGIKNGSRATLIRATKAEADAYNSGEMEKGFTINNINKYQNYFKKTTIAGTEYEIAINTDARTVTLSWLDGNGKVQTTTIPYYYSSTGINFATPFVNGSTKLNGLNDLAFNSGTTTLSFSTNGNTSTIAGTANPINIDQEAPERWYNYAINQDDYWVSFSGFRVNGVDDAFSVNSLTIPGGGRFVYYAFWPHFYTNPYDLFCPIFRNSAGLTLPAYRPVTATPPRFTNDGRIIFEYLGNAGQSNLPATGPVINTLSMLESSAGFYLIQTSATSYDMVSAADSRIWITWEI